MKILVTVNSSNCLLRDSSGQVGMPQPRTILFMIAIMIKLITKAYHNKLAYGQLSLLCSLTVQLSVNCYCL